MTKLEAAIKASGLSNAQVAKGIGVRLGLFKKYVTGEKYVPLGVIWAVAKFLKVPIWEIG